MKQSYRASPFGATHCKFSRVFIAPGRPIHGSTQVVPGNFAQATSAWNALSERMRAP